MDLSLISPAFNEREALPGLIEEIDGACASLGVEWETIVIDDGSTDGTAGIVRGIAARRRVGVRRTC